MEGEGKEGELMQYFRMLEYTTMWTCIWTLEISPPANGWLALLGYGDGFDEAVLKTVELQGRSKRGVIARWSSCKGRWLDYVKGS